MNDLTAFAWMVLALAGGLGAACRFLVDSWVARHNRLSTPMGTTVVNLTACFLMGLLTGWGMRDGSSSVVVAVLGTGLLGGYSTFSTASVEGARLLLAGRFGAGVLHAGGMVVGGLAAAFVGVALVAP